MCSADSVRAERTKVVENKCCGLSEIFLSNRNGFLWPLDLIRFCVRKHIRQNPSAGRSSPRETCMSPSLDVSDVVGHGLWVSEDEVAADCR